SFPALPQGMPAYVEVPSVDEFYIPQRFSDWTLDPYFARSGTLGIVKKFKSPYGGPGARDPDNLSGLKSSQIPSSLESV
ncbi:hypothetical protein PENTCL1PPCAC_5530, partial [Pristionchus entomophagus]